jgi:GH25 family lysozyme M1 (1,4-beta-N-acetylmuramidase)
MEPRAWGIDVSYHNPALNWQALKEAGMTFAIIKASMRNSVDQRCQLHAAAARSAGIPLVGLYHWSDPTGTIHQQGANFTKARNLAPRTDFAATDNEQWWQDWDQYHAAVQNKLPWNQVQRLPPVKIADFNQQMTQRIKAITAKFTLNYTSRWFIRGFAPAMAGWVNEFPLWVADWITWGMPLFKLETWQQFYRVIDNLTTPRLPDGAKTWAVWQFADARIRLPGMPGLDINVFNGSRAEMIQHVTQGTTPPPPPPPAGSYTAYITANVLIVRDAPNGNTLPWTTWYIDFNQTMKPVIILEEKDGWGRTDRGWIGLKYVVRA